MKTITLEQFLSFIDDNITSDEDQKKVVLRYLLTEFKGTDGEFIKTDVEPVLILEQCDNLFVPNINVYINIKKTTIFLIACLCDIFYTKGVAVGIGTITGNIEKSIHFIKPEDCCVFSRVLYYDKYFEGATIDTLENEFDGLCNSVSCKRCPHRVEECNCELDRAKIKLCLNDLILSKTISPDTENKFRLN
ncbi:hypothetical protein SAMN04487770_12934 [Butyrivibrio sp. ob235]|uniref:hypothetical protein n=1 Tax=Butyrivibrio sp. ob235 TaxID=1761780 RepID=UPI0008B174AA|nr:hypothetical protein [Butyrivibrio sp. ob235]SEM22423.1 hypothetical protein SAMN04487770_12934 [Butyrivibrio sp. ob235]